LLAQHVELLSRVAQAEARGQGLSPADRPDAVQEALCGVCRMLANAKTSAPRPLAARDFIRLLRRVVKARVCDQARRVRHHQGHCDQPTPSGDPSTSEVAEPVAAGSDPADLAERSETVARVQEVLRGLVSLDRRLIESLLNRRMLHGLGRRLRRPYGVLKRRRRQVLARVQQQLRDLLE
jgi:DNA-directed RNA polymerase specialized sigma24 family protein